MYQLEKIGENSFYFKAIGSLPPSIAEEAIENFLKLTKDMPKFSAIIDLSDARLIKFDSFKIIIEFFRKNESKLIKTGIVISENPPLDTEFDYILKQVKSAKRKIVSTLEDAKNWIGIKEIIVQKE